MATQSSEVARQIERRMRALNLNPFSLAKQAGMSRTAVYDILSGKSRHPRHDTLEKICSILGCSLSDLMGETGSLPSSPRGGYAEHVTVVPEIDVRGLAEGALAEELDGTPVLTEWQLPLNLLRMRTQSDSQALRIVTVHGDSMIPDFTPGERVMVDVTDRMPSPPGVFVVWDGFGLVLKRLEMVPYSEPARMRVVSTNASYEPRELPAERVRVSGRVIGKWHWV